MINFPRLVPRIVFVFYNECAHTVNHFQKIAAEFVYMAAHIISVFAVSGLL